MTDETICKIPLKAGMRLKRSHSSVAIRSFPASSGKGVDYLCRSFHNSKNAEQCIEVLGVRFLSEFISGKAGLNTIPSKYLMRMFVIRNGLRTECIKECLHM